MSARCWRASVPSPRSTARLAGAGACFAVNERNREGQPGPGDGRVSGIVSISAGYRRSDCWLTRITWNRVVTRYNRDTDVIQAGLGYRF